MKYTIGIAVFVLLLGGLAWFVFDGERAPDVELGSVPSVRSDLPSASPVVAEPPVEETEQETRRSSVQEASSGDSTAGCSAHVVGRCVNENGEPLVGCVVRFRGGRANSERMDEYLRDHDPVEWTAPESITTGEDGSFAFEFVPPPPYRFYASIMSTGRVALSGSWSEIAYGRRIDLGDCALVPGVEVTGRVVTTKGSPVAEANVSLQYENPRGPAAMSERLNTTKLRSPDSESLRTAADGSFVVRRKMLPGRWSVSVRDQQLERPTSIELIAARPVERVEIVVAAHEVADTISGVVADDRGEPIARARVMAHPLANGFQSAKRDGRFTFHRGPSDRDEPLTIYATADGYEDASPGERIPWGTTDLRIEMKRGLDVEVCVKSTSGEPIENYGLRVFPKPGTRRSWSSSQSEVCYRGTHEDGLTIVTGLVRGSHYLIVEPQGKSWCRSSLHEFEVTDSGAARQYVELHAAVSRVVRVRRANGDPVAGTTVQLIESIGGNPVDAATVLATPMALGQNTSPDQGLRVDEGKTDAVGEVTVQGPSATAMSLRVIGDRHAPLCRDGIVLGSGDGPIEIVVPDGARVVGKLVPIELLDQLRREAGVAQTGEQSPRDRMLMPGILLSRTEGSKRIEHPLAGKLPFEADGSFTITGVPPGDWVLTLVASRGDQRTSTTHRLGVALVSSLTEGETRDVELDLSRYLRATLSAHVLLDGAPFADGQVHFQGDGGQDASGEVLTHWLQPTTDASGDIEQLMPPGTYRVSLRMLDPESKRWFHVAVPTPVTVAPGEHARTTIAVQTATRRIVVRDSNGEKVKRCLLYAHNTGNDQGTWLPEADADGVVRVRLAVGSWQLRVQHVDLFDPAKSQEFYRQHAGDPQAWKRALHDVKLIQFTRGETVDIPVELPASAGF
ncbi:MAG: carboxypeptidase regulatory-like domain-containing protein [Planctomycetes bacterium]|nr:carboxypeptidase regulatory-like domain-containing protein [Planctomycetota bacterium]